MMKSVGFGIVVASVLCLVLASAGTARAQNQIADSFDDWSTDGEQGALGWYNGWYNLSEDELNGDGVYEADDFQEFFNEFGPGGGAVTPAGNHWSGTVWDLDGAGAPWSLLGQSTVHPNGTNNGDEH